MYIVVDLHSTNTLRIKATSIKHKKILYDSLRYVVFLLCKSTTECILI